MPYLLLLAQWRRLLAFPRWFGYDMQTSPRSRIPINCDGATDSSVSKEASVVISWAERPSNAIRRWRVWFKTLPHGTEAGRKKRIFCDSHRWSVKHETARLAGGNRQRTEPYVLVAVFNINPHRVCRFFCIWATDTLWGSFCHEMYHILCVYNEVFNSSSQVHRGKFTSKYVSKCALSFYILKCCGLVAETFLICLYSPGNKDQW